ncbi:general transcription factor 3C polypeptide 1 isoform X2 [Orussus abietinus]|uniref:general transcription factor 3C polypeptide 1 isoform X2 n=1 Tax=Orussus abietinus TaxID=222816 RepID=UPI0006254FAF|nr:general transcription factor 3C polypeptide 1 isoform X2 [Orussus abietinus]
MYTSTMNLVDIVIDEVALEGLDALRRRLEVRIPDSISLNGAFMTQVWSICVHVKEFSFYDLGSPREELVILDRYAHVDPVLGIVIEPESVPKDIYPHCPVDETKTGVKGSCSTFDVRKEVSNLVKAMTLDEVTEKYGEQMVIVASQDLRDCALLGSDVCPILELNSQQHCYLERVGRARYHGEVTQGKLSLGLLKEDPKTLFYRKKLLFGHKLITKQIHHQKTSKHCCSGSVIHLPRFFVDRKPKAVRLAENMIEILKSKNNYTAEYDEIRGALEIGHSIKKLLKTSFFQKVAKTGFKKVIEPVHSSSNSKRKKVRKKEETKERIKRVVQLLQPDPALVDSNNDAPNEEDHPVELEISEQMFNVPLTKEANNLIASRGASGMSQLELGRHLGITKLHSRTILRNLSKSNIVASYMKDEGRQRLTRYISKLYEKNSSIRKLLHEEVSKIKELTKKVEPEDTEMISHDLNISYSQKTISPTNMVNSEGEKGSFPVKCDLQDNDFEQRVKTQQQTFSVVRRILRRYRMNFLQNKYRLTGCNLSRYFKKVSENSTDLQPSDFVSVNLKSGNNVSYNDAAGSVKSVPTIDSVEMKANIFQLDTEGRLENSVIRRLEQLQTDRNKKTPSITYRLLKRANIIISAVKEYKIIDDVVKFMKMIQEEEDKEGYNVKIDKKSLTRLLRRLANDNIIKNIEFTLSIENKKKHLTFICDPSVGIDDPFIQSALERAKLRLFLGSSEAHTVTTEVSTDHKPPVITSDVFHESDNEKDTKASEASLSDYIVQLDFHLGMNYEFGRRLGRMQVLYSYLHYLIYDHPRNKRAASQCYKRIVDEFSDADIELSTFCKPDVSWKTFVPPLPKYEARPPGWGLARDIFMRIPLSIYLKVRGMTLGETELKKYTRDPIERHVLLRDLPARMKKFLLSRESREHSVYETVAHLCTAGLIRPHLDPQNLEESKQFIYLVHRYDLPDEISPPVNSHCDEKSKEYPYIYNTAKIIEEYWYEVKCKSCEMHLEDPLTLKSKDFLSQGLKQEIERLKNLVTARSSTTDLDITSKHVRKNSSLSVEELFLTYLKRRQSKKFINYFPEFQRRLSLSQNLKPTLNAKSEINSINQSDTCIDEVSTLEHEKSKAEREKTLKKPTSRKRKVRSRVKYDEVDYSALRRMDKLRVDWDSHEDNILLMCKVAMMYLFPNPRRQLISFPSIRDVLRTYSSTSFNKTSKACQRRLQYMLRKPQTVKSVALCLEEIKQNIYVTKRFGGIADKIRKSYSDPVECEKKVNKVFKELVAYIAKKYYKISHVEAKVPMIAPKTAEEFALLYSLKRPVKPSNHFVHSGDVNNVCDIYSSVVMSIIHSSMCCSKDRNSWAHQLFKIYQQYPESLLRNAIAKLKSTRMMSVKKKYVCSVKKYGMVLPMSCSQYQLSPGYIHKFQTKWPYECFTEAFKILSDLVNGKVENPSVSLQFGLDEVDGSNVKHIEAFPVSGGTVVFMQDFVSANRLEFDVEIPEQIITLDPKLGEKDEVYVRIAQRYHGLLSAMDSRNEGIARLQTKSNTQEVSTQNVGAWKKIEEDKSTDLACVKDCEAISQDELSTKSWVCVAKHKSDDEVAQSQQKKSQRSELPFSDVKKEWNKYVGMLNCKERKERQDVKITSSCGLNAPRKSVVASGTVEACQGASQELVRSNSARCIILFQNGMRIPLKKQPNSLTSNLEDNERSEAGIVSMKRKRNVEELTTESSGYGNENRESRKHFKPEEDGKGKPEVLSLESNNAISTSPSDVIFEKLGSSEMLPSTNELNIVNEEQGSLCTSKTSINTQKGLALTRLVNRSLTRCLSRNRSSNSMKEWSRTNDIINNAPCEDGWQNSSRSYGNLVDATKCYTRMALLTMREELNNLTLTDSHHAHEYFVVNAFKVFYAIKTASSQVLDSHQHKLLAEELQTLVNFGQQIIQNLKRTTLFHENRLSYTDLRCYIRERSLVFWEHIDSVTKFIFQYKEMGTSVKELSENFPELWESALYEILFLLVEIQAVLRCGVTVVRYVHRKYADPWLLHSQKISRLVRESLPVPSLENKCGSNCKEEQNSQISQKNNSQSEHFEPMDCMDNEPRAKDRETPAKDAEIVLENISKKEKLGKESEDSNLPNTRRRKAMSIMKEQMSKSASYFENQNAKNVKVIIKPWIRVDGVLNRRVLDRMLGAVLAYCIMHPGSAITKVQNRFLPALQPIHTRELIEILVKLKCLRMKLLRIPTVTLVSVPSIVKCKETTSGLADDGYLIIEPLINASLHFGAFLSSKMYSTSFL